MLLQEGHVRVLLHVAAAIEKDQSTWSEGRSGVGVYTQGREKVNVVRVHANVAVVASKIVVDAARAVPDVCVDEERARCSGLVVWIRRLVCGC